MRWPAPRTALGTAPGSRHRRGDPRGSCRPRGRRSTRGHDGLQPMRGKPPQTSEIGGNSDKESACSACYQEAGDTRSHACSQMRRAHTHTSTHNEAGRRVGCWYARPIPSHSWQVEVVGSPPPPQPRHLCCHASSALQPLVLCRRLNCWRRALTCSLLPSRRQRRHERSLCDPEQHGRAGVARGEAEVQRVLGHLVVRWGRV